MYLNIFLFATLLIFEIKQKALLPYYTTIIGLSSPTTISTYQFNISDWIHD